MSAVADEIWEILRGLAKSHEEFKVEQKAFRESQKETERIIEKIQRETAREIQKVNKSVGQLTNRLGEFVEEAVRPATVKLFRERGIDVHEVHQNITAKRDGEGVEIDLLVVNNNHVVIIECKSNLSVDDVNEHIERLEKAKRLVASCENKRILGAVAGMVIPANVASTSNRKQTGLNQQHDLLKSLSIKSSNLIFIIPNFNSLVY